MYIKLQFSLWIWFIRENLIRSIKYVYNVGEIYHFNTFVLEWRRGRWKPELFQSSMFPYVYSLLLL